MNQPDINLLRPRRIHGWQEYQTNNDQIPLPAQNKQKRSFLFYLIPGLAVILIFGAFSLVRYYTLAKWTGNANEYHQLTLQPTGGFLDTIKNFFFRPNKVMAGQATDRINILILGIGGENHDGGYLSDTNIILSLKPSTNEVAMISVPRDLAAKIDGYGWTKINHAHAYGEMKKSGYGGEFARQTFAENLKIDLPYFLVVDFTAFKEIIEIVGGVEIDVPNSFVDYSYPTNDYGYQTVTFNKGKEKMSGERALIFTRSRHGNNGEGSDFARARRQQLVIAAVKEKILSANTYLNPIKIKKIIDSLSKNINTNIEFNQILYLAGLAKDINSDNIKTLVLDDSPNGFLQNIIGYDGAYLLSPKGENFNLIRQAINGIFSSTSTPSIYTLKTTPSSNLLFPTTKIEIQNGTWRIGLAARAKQNLENSGFAIYQIGNTAYRPVASTSLYILNMKTETGFIQALERIVGAVATTSLPTWMPTATSTTSSLSISNLTETNISSNTSATSTASDENEKSTYDSQTDILVILGEDY